MERKKLLIADATDDFPIALTQFLQDQYEICCCQSGKKTLALLESYQPDLLILDLMLPELDGISLLQAAAASGLKANVLVVSRMFNEYTLNFLGQLGIRYAIRKPCDLRATADRIADLISQPDSHAPRSDPTPKILSLLHTLQFSPKHDGYTYLQKAIVEMSRNPGQSVTKELYPTVAALCHCSGGQVERCIRTAISAAWNACDRQVWINTFSLDPFTPPKRPTNTEFIVRSIEILRKS